MPSLIAEHREKATVAKLKKAYSSISQAYLSIISEEGDLSSIESYNDIQLMEKFGKYLKYSKACGRDKGCFPDVTYKSITNTDYENWDNHSSTRSRAIMEDGTLIMFNVSNVANDLLFQIYVDINGFQGPNQLGKDFFYFYALSDKIIPGGSPILKDMNIAAGDFKKYCMQRDGYACAAWVIYNENMDYLHCDDLDWGTKTKCK